jgi:DNA polymerase (family 10)
MPVHNHDIAAIFYKMADLLELEGANVFRIRAYRNAAATILNISQSLEDMVRLDQGLSGLKGIGKDLASKIREIVYTGNLGQLQEMEQRIQPGLVAFMRLPGMGPKKVAVLQKQRITTLEQLKQAAQTGLVQQIPGFGVKTEQQILQAIQQAEAAPRRTRFFEAEYVAHTLIRYLRSLAGVHDVVPAGSFRRRKETVADLDLLALTSPRNEAMAAFTHYPDAAKILAHGKTKSTIVLRSGLQVDLRALPEESFGAGLLYFTGSKAHNIAIRTLGVQRKLKINEYGVFQGERRIAGRTEKEMYASLDLPFIEPELREDQGEIQAAQQGTLPHLLELRQIRGDLHSHTQETDGKNSLEEMAQAAQAHGYQYLGVTDHTQHVTVARGMDPSRVRTQIRRIDAWNRRGEGIRLLKGMECDILDNGRLDLPDEILAELDYTVCSVHYKFKLSQEEQTARVLAAMDNPHFTIFAHPTGRLLEERPAYLIDIERILQGARERGCFVELNSDPTRLDLNDVHCHRAKSLGVKVAVSTDAHSTWGLDNIRFGLGQARRGWLEAGDVLNTRTLDELLPLLHRRKT